MESNSNGGNNLSRRSFVGAGLGAMAALSLPIVAEARDARLERLGRLKLLNRNTLLFPAELQGLTLPVLPYADTALEPVISKTTISFHYGKHTKAYYDNLAKQVVGTDYANITELEKIVRASAGKMDTVSKGIFNNSSQALNHSFYFAGLKQGGGGEPTGELLEAIKAAFGGVAEFKAAFLAAATGQFGSGWAWLVMDHNEKLKIISTGNADSPITSRTELPMAPLFVADVWEHAYYLDYQNLRAGHVTAVLNSLINWDFVAANFAKAKA